MKKYLIFPLIVLLVLTALPLASCTGESEKYSAHSFNYFDTVTTITGYAASREEFDAVADAILSELAEYHRLFTIYHRYDGLENLCTINELTDGVHRTVTVDRRIVDMLLYAKEMYETTNGRVNIALGSVLSIWHDYRSEGMNNPASAKLPPMEALTAAAEHTDIRNLVIDEAACTVTITDPAMTLDVGAVAKGYAVEMIARDLESGALTGEPVTGYVLNVGGNVRTLGYKGDGSPWIVGIENPLDEAANPYRAYLNLSGQSLVTSGSYQRYYLVEGKRYHHIIDPDTLMPGELYLSVSVVTPSSADGDALSTALFCMTPEEGKALVESLPQTEAMWVLPDGTRLTTSGWKPFETST